jgi:hypothetical protein
MNIQIERRIRAAEKAVTAFAPPARPPKMMFYPVGGDDADVKRHRAEVEQAERDGFFVIQLVPLSPKSEGDKA